MFKSIKNNSYNMVLLFPSVAIVGFVMFFPTIYAFYISLTKWKLNQPPVFIGFSNYIEMFKMPELVHSIWITIVFSALVVTFTIITSLYFAVLLNMDLVGTKVVTALLLIPWAIPPVVNGVMWKWFFEPRFGVFNNVLLQLGLIDNFRVWSSENWPALAIVILTSVYKLIPIATFFFLAALKTIPDDLYEAGKIDGLSPVGAFGKITLPLIRPTISIILILLTVSAFKAFDMIFVLTKGGPANFTSVLNFYSYTITFRQVNFGLGSAIAFFLSFLILIISIIYFKISYKDIGY